MNLDDVAVGLAESLSTIPGMRVHSEVPQKINPPAAIVGLGAGNTETMDSLASVEFGILVLLSTSSSERSQKELRGFCQSVPDAVETTDLLSGDVSTGCSVDFTGWDAPAVVTLGGIDYIGIEFHLSVIE